MNKIQKAVNHFLNLVNEDGEEDVAAWEHMAHIRSALEAKSEREAMAILEDAVGCKINWESF